MHLKLPTLKYRRLHGDMIEVFKITRFLLIFVTRQCRCVQSGASADMFCGQFGTGAEVFWVRSVLGPKCLYSGNCLATTDVGRKVGAAVPRFVGGWSWVPI